MSENGITFTVTKFPLALSCRTLVRSIVLRESARLHSVGRDGMDLVGNDVRRYRPAGRAHGSTRQRQDNAGDPISRFLTGVSYVPRRLDDGRGH